MAQLSKDAELDWCDACGGVYIDWMDGTLTRLATTVRPPKSVQDKSTELPDEASCAACNATMVRDSVEPDLALLRCTACFGCFVPRTTWQSFMTERPEANGSEPLLTRFLDSIRDALLPGR